MNNSDYLKKFIKISIIFFLISFLLMASIAFLTKDDAKEVKNEKDAKIEIVTEEKTVEDFEKLEMIKKVFKSENSADLESDQKTLEAIPESEIKIANEEKISKPVSEPNVEEPSEQAPKLTEIVLENKEKAEQLSNESSENSPEKTSPEKIDTKDLKLPATKQSVVSSPIFDFQEGKNYQKLIASFIAEKKMPNVNSEELATIIITESQAAKINPVLVAMIIEEESSFNRYHENINGRVGLMQVHPNEAMKITKQLDLPFLGTVSLFHPIYNIRLGLNLLQSLKESNKNSWEEAVKKFSKSRNPQVANAYLKKIKDNTKKIEDGIATN